MKSRDRVSGWHSQADRPICKRLLALVAPPRRALPFLFVALVALLATVAPTTANAQAPALAPSLMGEGFTALTNNGVGFGEIDVSAQCTPTSGETFRLTYRASGPAYGPYPGTFTERGTATVTLTQTSSPGVASGVVTSFDATFTIDSAVGQVSGKKTLGANPLFTSAQCIRTDNDRTFGSKAFFDSTLAGAELEYEATIRTALGTFSDQGKAQAQASAICAGDVRPTCTATQGYFLENFTLSTGVVLLDTPGKATGGGQVPGTSQSSPISFGFEAISREGTVPGQFDRQGRCVVEDKARNTTVKCLDVTSYIQVGKHATFRGRAEVNGKRTNYRIDVDDLGEPNQGKDTFKIVTDSGYTAGGNVPNGDVQVFPNN